MACIVYAKLMIFYMLFSLTRTLARALRDVACESVSSEQLYVWCEKVDHICLITLYIQTPREHTDLGVKLEILTGLREVSLASDGFLLGCSHSRLYQSHAVVVCVTSICVLQKGKRLASHSLFAAPFRRWLSHMQQQLGKLTDIHQARFEATTVFEFWKPIHIVKHFIWRIVRRKGVLNVPFLQSLVYVSITSSTNRWGLSVALVFIW